MNITMKWNPRPKNLLLRSLPADYLKEYTEELIYKELPRKEVLAERGEILEHVYFPENGMVSMVLVTSDGISIEVGTIGREGFVGVPLVLGTVVSDRKLISQVSGYGWQIKADVFKRMIAENENLRVITKLFALTMLNQIAQTAACNRLHSIDERCARWLLIAEEKAGAQTFNLSQDFLSMMLGVRRSSVNIAIRALEENALVYNARAAITVKNREGLEKISCACYKEVKDFYSETMGLSL